MSKEVKHTVRIHIDQKQLMSPNPTTGIDLYELGELRNGLVLFQEVANNQKDRLVRIDLPSINLSEDEHFHTGEAPRNHYLITINTDPFVVDHYNLSFDEIVMMAFPEPPTGTDPAFTVSYDHAVSKPHHGDLAAGAIVIIKKHGTNFDVAHTNRS